MKYLQDKRPENKVQSSADSLSTKTVQNKVIALQDNRPASIVQKKTNSTGLPTSLKSGIENLSGHTMDDVKVHYNSSKPAQLNAHAYAQGTDIHIASGQEKHLAHEAWHVVQQKQGRVKPTLQMKNKVNVNDDKGLEHEADVMGAKALQTKSGTFSSPKFNNSTGTNTVQGYFKYGPLVINSAELVHEHFKKSHLDSSKIKKNDKERVKEERWNALIAMAITKKEEGTANNTGQLIEIVTNFANAQKLLSKGIGQEGTSAKNVSASGMMESGDLSALTLPLQATVNYILKSKRVFPEEHIYRTAKNAMGLQGGGFIVELNLVESILKSRSHIKVQLGVVHQDDLNAETIGFVPDASTKPITGLVGGDLTIWEHPDAKVKKHTFIQSKTANEASLSKNVTAAANQLASLTASGDPKGKDDKREFTMTGSSFEGVIYVLYTGRLDAAKLKLTAKQAINKHPLFVHKVIFEIDNDFFVVTSNDLDGKILKSNPLQTSSGLTSSPSASSSSSSEMEEKKEDALLDGLDLTEDNIADEMSIIQHSKPKKSVNSQRNANKFVAVKKKNKGSRHKGTENNKAKIELENKGVKFSSGKILIPLILFFGTVFYLLHNYFSVNKIEDSGSGKS